jgi:hypothetical protein
LYVSNEINEMDKALLRKPITNAALAAFVEQHPATRAEHNTFQLQLDVGRLHGFTWILINELFGDSSLLDIQVTAFRNFSDRTFYFNIPTRKSPQFTFAVRCDRFDRPWEIVGAYQNVVSGEQLVQTVPTTTEQWNSVAKRERAFCYNIAVDVLQAVGRQLAEKQSYYGAFLRAGVIRVTQNVEGPYVRAGTLVSQIYQSVEQVAVCAVHVRADGALAALLEQIYNVHAADKSASRVDACYGKWIEWAHEISGIPEDDEEDELAARLARLKADTHAAVIGSGVTPTSSLTTSTTSTTLSTNSMSK